MTIRWRLTLWYGGLLAGALVMFGTIVYAAFARNLLGEVDRALDEELMEIDKDVRAATDLADLQRRLHHDFADHPFYEIRVVEPSGAVLFGTNGAHEQTLGALRLEQEIEPRATVRVEGGRREYRIASRRSAGPVGPLVIQAADSLDLYQGGLRELLTVLWSTSPLVLIGALAGGWLLSTRALAPVDRMIGTAREITALRLDRRIPVANPADELGRLAATFNEMIARLEMSFQEIRQFTADAAHELRTPLAVLRCEAEVALRTARTTDEFRDVLKDQLDEIERLTRLAEELLLLCREEARLTAPKRAPLRLDLLLEDVVETMAAPAELRGIELKWAGPAVCVIEADCDRLRRVFFNLIDNAIKYTPAGGTVDVTCRLAGDRVKVEICDTGIGISADHLPRVFQRFYRVDSSRTGAAGGSGLGLAIARSLVEAQEGTIQLESESGVGTRVTVTLSAEAPDCRSDSRDQGRDQMAARLHSVTGLPGATRAHLHSSVGENSGAVPSAVGAANHVVPENRCGRAHDHPVRG